MQGLSYVAISDDIFFPRLFCSVARLCERRICRQLPWEVPVGASAIRRQRLRGQQLTRWQERAGTSSPLQPAPRDGAPKLRPHSQRFLRRRTGRPALCRPASGHLLCPVRIHGVVKRGRTEDGPDSSPTRPRSPARCVLASPRTRLDGARLRAAGRASAGGFMSRAGRQAHAAPPCRTSTESPAQEKERMCSASDTPEGPLAGLVRRRTAATDITNARLGHQCVCGGAPTPQPVDASLTAADGASLVP